MPLTTTAAGAIRPQYTFRTRRDLQRVAMRLASGLDPATIAGIERAGSWSIRVDDQWRIWFAWRGFDVELVDHHRGACDDEHRFPSSAAQADALLEVREVDLRQLATTEDIRELRVEITAVRAGMKLLGAELRGEIARAMNRLLLWLVPLMRSQIGALLWLLLRPVATIVG